MVRDSIADRAGSTVDDEAIGVRLDGSREMHGTGGAQQAEIESWFDSPDGDRLAMRRAVR